MASFLVRMFDLPASAADAFADDGEADILRMYRHTRAPTLIIRCTESGAPAVLDQELDALTAANEAVQVLRLPLTHLAPAWDAIDDVVVEIGPGLGSLTLGLLPAVKRVVAVEASLLG